MNVNSLITKDYRKNDVFAAPKTNPIQTQFPKGQNRLLKNLATPLLSQWKKIIDMPLLLWNNKSSYED